MLAAVTASLPVAVMSAVDAHFESSSVLAALRAGDETVFTELVRHYHRRLAGFAAGIAGPAIAEEVVQEAWVAIWRNLPAFEGRASLKTWLYTIVRNGCIQRLRQEARLPTVAIEEELHRDGIDGWLAANFVANGHWRQAPQVWSHDTPEALLEEGELRRCLEHHIEGLQALQRSVFQLRDIEQLSMEEICNILELTASNARVLLHRARLKLLQVINHYQETGQC